MNKNSKIYIAGHTGLVGSALYTLLVQSGFENILTRTHKELDLIRQREVEAFFSVEKPEYVFLCAAKVGGIMANNTYKADFMYHNTLIALNVIHTAYQNNVKKLLNLGSSCIYPKFAEQPIVEDSLLTGVLEPTNEPYAIAKIAAIKMCRYYNEQYGTHFMSAMPCNLYGPEDNFSYETSHVLPAMVRKFHYAKTQKKSHVLLWGDGTPRREFLYSSDLVEALLFLMHNISVDEIQEHINIGSGKDITIENLAKSIQKIVGFSGEIQWDTQKPNGTPQKLMNISKIQSLGWKPKISLEEGIQKIYKWFLDSQTSS